MTKSVSSGDEVAGAPASRSGTRLLVAVVFIYNFVLLGMVINEALSGIGLIVALVAGVALNERMARRLITNKGRPSCAGRVQHRAQSNASPDVTARNSVSADTAPAGASCGEKPRC